MVVKHTNQNREEHGSGWFEFSKMVPQLLWFGLAAVAFYLLYPILLLLIESGGISKIGVAGVVVELTNVPGRRDDQIDAAKQGLMSSEDRKELTKRFHRLADKTIGANILWVDDKHPQQNVRERRVLLAASMNVDLARSTDEALEWLRHSRYQVLITNLRRDNDAKEPCTENAPASQAQAGCDLVKKAHDRYQDAAPAMIIYTGRVNERLGTPAHASGITSQPAELFRLILNALEKRKAPV